MAVNFTEDQRRAIEYKSLDVCVVAGPGSGKTTVLVERYRELLEKHQFDPREILAITFTEKAAANMKVKLAGLFGHDPERQRDLESAAWVSTIHGFCMRLLRENAIAAGLDPRFTVLSARDADRLQWECLQFALDEITEQRRAETLELIEALLVPRLDRNLKDVYDAIRSAGMSIRDVRKMPSPIPPGTANSAAVAAGLRALLRTWPSQLTPVQAEEKARLLEACQAFESVGAPDLAAFLRFAGMLNPDGRRTPRGFKPALDEFRDFLANATAAAVDRHTAPFRALIFDALARFDEDYRNRKNVQGRVDFNDLERHTIALLKDNPEIRKRVQKQFRQIMLDEFQDINGQQSGLIALLRSENVFFGVGDRNQSIYGFRYARPEIFLEYRAEVAESAAQSVELFANFRSRAAILRCVGTVLSGKSGIEDRDLVSGGAFAAKDEPCIEVLKIHDAENDKDAASEREAAWIAHRVNALRGTLQLGEPGRTRLAEYRDFAVLCRSGESMQPVLAAFDCAGIPYVCGRRQSFLVSRSGLDITALLRVIANPFDGISLATLLRSPLVGISDESLLRLRLLAGNLTSGLHVFRHKAETCGLTEPDAGKLTRFCRNLERWRSDQPIVPLDILLARVLKDCSVDWMPASSLGPDLGGADIESFLYFARTVGATMDLPAFLREIESLTETAGTDSELSDVDQGDRVQVMTAHAAKGLEFNITIVAAIDKGARVGSAPVTFTPECGLGVKWRNPASGNGDDIKDSWAAKNKEITSAREKEEENRLLYVAMTRAAEHLILSYSCGKSKPSNWAKLVEECFGIQSAKVSPEAHSVELDGFAASILVTDADPPACVSSQVDRDAAGVLTITTPDLEDRHDTAVTVTSLAVFGACPRKYYLQRSLGWNNGRFSRFDAGLNQPDSAEDEPDDADLSASGIGSAVHQILAGITPAEDYPEARRLANVFFQSELGRQVAASPRAEREWAFIADIDGSIVRGTVDLWFEAADGELQIVDYKTDVVNAASAPARALEYAPQLALYAIALERALDSRPKTAWVYFLRPDTVVEIPLDDAAIGKARSLIAVLREAQDALRFDLNEGEHCRKCQFYKSLCPAGRQFPDAGQETTA